MSRMKTFAIIGCGIIAAGVGLVLIRRRRTKTDKTPSRGPSGLAASSTASTGFVYWHAHGSESTRPEENADDKKEPTTTAREQAARDHFHGVGAVMASEGLLFEDEEDSDPGEEEDAIRAMLGRADAEAEEDARFNLLAGRGFCDAMDYGEVFMEDAFRDGHSDINDSHHISLKSIPRAQS